MHAYRKAILALEDGTWFRGRAFAGHGDIEGDLVFNTAMTGYQEILTDPSYFGQIVTMTYPLIGNYGVNEQDVESWRPHCSGLVVGECSRLASNWRASMSLPDYLEKHGLIGIDLLDTRAITLHIRSQGAMKAVVSTEEPDPDTLVDRARASQGLVGRDLASEVSTPERYRWRDRAAELGRPSAQAAAEPKPYRVAVIDCGIKYNQLRMLSEMGCDLEVFPLSSPPEDILATDPDGIFVSNGPGDPEGVPYLARTLRALIETGERPLFGICFGHQVIALALGARTFKLKFGHRGANQPVLNTGNGRVEITSQNHGFCVDRHSLDESVALTSHVNLNDDTSAGLRHRERPVFSVQYHPEACPGPHDSHYLFREFIDLMEQRATALRAG